MITDLHAIFVLPAFLPLEETAHSAEGSLSTAAALAMGGAVAASMLTAWVLVALARRDRRRHGPTVRHLARSLGLGLIERQLLHRVARAAGLSQPGGLLVSRGCFDHAVRSYAARWGADRRLEAIRRRVFGNR